MWLLDKMLRRLIHRGRLVVTDHDGKVYSYGNEGAEPVMAIRFTQSDTANRIARYPRLGAGEAYMDGHVLIDPPHDLRDFVLFMGSQADQSPNDPFPIPRFMTQLGESIMGRLDSYNPRGKAAKNAAHTYNLTRQLYELFLDEDRQYTMAYWREPDITLEQAQLDKKAHIAAKLNIKPGMKVLDIGCGWGGWALYLNKMYGVEVTGVALAEDQIAFCKERAEAEGVADKVKFHLMDYRDVEGTFDRITAIGLLEHVGVPHYQGFYDGVYRLLKEDGVFFTHCCGRTRGPGVTDAWTRKYIFPGGYIPALSELVAPAETGRWQIMDVEAMRFHYAPTLAEWYRRTVLHREEIVELYDERFFRMWQFYLAGAEQAFQNGGMVNWQILYVKRRDAIPMTRDYMVEESARLRAAAKAPTWHLDPALKEAAE